MHLGGETEVIQVYFMFFLNRKTASICAQTYLLWFDLWDRLGS